MEQGSFTQGFISLSSQLVHFWCLMENCQFKTSSPLVKVLGGYHWYMQYNCISAWVSQEPSYDSGKRQRLSPAETFQEDLFHSLNQANTSFSVFTLFLPSSSCLAGTSFSHANSSLDNYVSSNPCKREKYLERTHKGKKNMFGCYLWRNGKFRGRKTKETQCQKHSIPFLYSCLLWETMRVL